MQKDNTGTYPKKTIYRRDNTSSTGSTYYQPTDNTGRNISGIFCSICGNKMYHDGKMWRCSSCHDNWTYPTNAIAMEE